MDRLVRTAEGTVLRDETGRRPGRGAYICNQPGCRDPERAAAAIKRALGAEPSPGALEFEVNDAAK
ncbi:MAG: YlxR family protein [Chloroflexota bacterium]|nr:YlxR family protein [Chloroflexota bacterium]